MCSALWLWLYSRVRCEWVPGVTCGREGLGRWCFDNDDNNDDDGDDNGDDDDDDVKYLFSNNASKSWSQESARQGFLKEAADKEIHIGNISDRDNHDHPQYDGCDGW